MDLTPQAIRATSFRRVKRGYDPEEVEAFRTKVADHVEHVQGQAETMESRARAAVAKLQELVDQQVRTAREGQLADDEAQVASDGDASGEQPEVISRTLLVAQRTAESMVAEARDEATRLLESARSMAARTIDDARHEARRASEDERVRAENEVHALLARRDFLLGDVEQLEEFLDSQRERLRAVADHLRHVAGDVPSGLGSARRPLLSASDDTDSFWDDDDPGETAPRTPPPAPVLETQPERNASGESVPGAPEPASPVTPAPEVEAQPERYVPGESLPDTGGASDLIGVDAALVEAALRIAIDAVHAETEALGTDRVVGDSRQGSSDAGSAFSVSLPVAGVHAEQDSVDSAIPAEGSAPGGSDEYVDTNDDGIAADVVGTVDLTTPLDAATRRSDSVGLEVSAHLVETDGRDDNGAVGNVGLPGDHSAPELVNAVAIRNGDEPVDAIDDGSEADDGTEVDDGSEVDDNDDLDDSGNLDDVDDTWDALRLPVRPLPVDADWDDDLPVSAAASAAERAARMHRVEPPQASPADRAPATPQRAGAPSSRPLDLLAERARQRGDVAGDEGSFRIGGDELH